MAFGKSPSTPRMASAFKKASPLSSNTSEQSGRIFTKTLRKHSAYEGVGKSEITNTQDRALGLSKKINRYYDKNRKRLVKKEYDRLSRSSLQTNLKYGPPGVRSSLNNYYKQQAKRLVYERQTSRTDLVDRISKRKQWQVVEKSRVVRERQKFMQEQKNFLNKEFGLSAHKQSL